MNFWKKYNEKFGINAIDIWEKYTQTHHNIAIFPVLGFAIIKKLRFHLSHCLNARQRLTWVCQIDCFCCPLWTFCINHVLIKRLRDQIFRFSAPYVLKRKNQVAEDSSVITNFLVEILIRKSFFEDYLPLKRFLTWYNSDVASKYFLKNLLHANFKAFLRGFVELFHTLALLLPTLLKP